MSCFQVLNLIQLKDIKTHWSYTTWMSHQDVYTSREQVSWVYFVCGGIDHTYKVQTYTSEVTCNAYSRCLPVK